MGLMDKMKIVANKAADALENGTRATIQGTLNTVDKLREEGLKDTAYDLGNKLGSKVKDVSEEVGDYVEKIDRSNRKAANPVGISFKSGTVANTTAKGVVKAINTIRILGQDTKEKLQDLTTEHAKVEDITHKPKIK